VKYRLKEIVEAEQWFPEEVSGVIFKGDKLVPDAWLFRNDYTKNDLCRCGKQHNHHGFLRVPGDIGFKVCPGDWIVTNSDGIKAAYKPDVFEQLYERVFDEE
jgi:hypothetical protein